MTVSVRSYLTVGVAALAASAVAVAPVQAPAPQSVSTATVRLSAAVQPLLQPIDAAAAVLGLVSTPAPAKPAAAAATSPQAAATANATGDWVANAWNFADYWISYAADLTQYVLGWVWPLNYIGDQAPILWYNLGSPIGDATVYGLIIPVLNDPLNWAVWSAGLSIIAQTTVTALINTGVAEFNYFLGWLIPPLPPRPFPPLPIPPLAATAPSTSAVAAEVVAAPTELPRNVNTAHAPRTRTVAAAEDAVAPATDAVESTPKKTVAEPTDAETTDVKADPQVPDTADATEADTPKSVAQDVKSGQNAAKDTVKKVRSAAGSARDHSEKKRAAHNSGN